MGEKSEGRFRKEHRACRGGEEDVGTRASDHREGKAQSHSGRDVGDACRSRRGTGGAGLDDCHGCMGRLCETGRKGLQAHSVANQGKGYGDSQLPNCHRVVSLLKRWILSILQGSVGKEHMQDYLNEFVFRFNRRNSKARGMLFCRLMQIAVGCEPTTRHSIIHPSQQELRV